MNGYEDRPNRSKAEFKALRELAGLTWEDMAETLGVQERAVRRWESDSEWNTAPQDAWDMLDEALASSSEVIFAAMDKVDEVTEQLGEPPHEIQLPYWSSKKEYIAYAANPGDGSGWKRANAQSRAIFWILAYLGCSVKWVPGNQNIVTQYKSSH